MYPVYAGPQSYWEGWDDGWENRRKYGTGRMEKLLTDEWLGHDLCLNQVPGGKGCTPGYPHFTYVATIEADL